MKLHGARDINKDRQIEALASMQAPSIQLKLSPSIEYNQAILRATGKEQKQ